MSEFSSQNPYAPPQARVEDVREQGVVELAGRGARLGAVIVDGVILAAIVIPIWILVLGNSFNDAGRFPQLIYYALLIQASYLLVNGVLLARHGQTVGKRLVGVRIVRGDGSRADFVRVFWLRYFANSLVMSIPVFGLIYMLVDSLLIFRQSRKCLHDNIADTVVIRT